MARESWRSQTGFILAALGSAIGLANIVRFPYIVGSNGGAAFIVLYLLCLLLVGFPVIISEVMIGRRTQSSPCGAFRLLGENKFWSIAGTGIVFTGFVVSAFYSALAGWILGYLMEAVSGHLNDFSSSQETIAYHTQLLESPLWGVTFHALFMSICALIVYTGVRAGIERACKWMMPLLFVVLITLLVKGLSMDGASKGLRFLLTPDWSAITPGAFLIALGQSFFTVSAGQGTMITYGSYLPRRTNLIGVCVPIVIADTLISILAAIAVFTIVFSVGMEPSSGLGLIFHTLPLVFSQITGGYLMAIFFFLLVSLAALTSQISAMEPVIAYLMDEKGWERHRAVVTLAIAAFVVGIPAALAFSILKGSTLFGMNWLEAFDFLATGILIPLGGLLAVLLVGWKWGLRQAFQELQDGGGDWLEKNHLLRGYFYLSLKYGAPILIVLVFLSALGLFG